MFDFIKSVIKPPPPSITHTDVLLSYYSELVLEDIVRKRGKAYSWLVKVVKKEFTRLEKEGVLDTINDPQSKSDVQKVMRKLSTEPYVALMFATEEASTWEEAFYKVYHQFKTVYLVYVENRSQMQDFSIMKYYRYYNKGFGYEEIISLTELKGAIRRYSNPNYNGGKIEAVTLALMVYLRDNIASYYKRM